MATDTIHKLQPEHAIATGLKKLGCLIEGDPVLDQEHGIQIVVVRFPNDLRFCPIAVQIAPHGPDKAKLQEFIKRNSAFSVAPKSVFLELETTNPDRCVYPILHLLYQFQFDRSHQKYSLGHGVVHSDLTYELKSIECASAGPQIVRKAAPAPVHPSLPGLPTPSKLHGTLNSWHEGNYGFITTSDGCTFYAHVTKIADESLKAILKEGDSMKIPVTFQNGGKAKPESRYDEAYDITQESVRLRAAAGN
jgi:cold shock CspA family protein